jgi:anthranilate phosphoribosyltransferase
VTPQAAIARLVDRRDLTETETRAVFEALLAGEATSAQVGALLVALRLKGETVAELTGVARVLRAHAVPLPDVPSGAIDTCGTGGDGARTFNISTAAALVVAACGVPVAKHGNRAMSGSVGSADVLEALGVGLELSPSRASECLRTVGIAFLFAPAFHPVLRQVGPVRRELGVRTLFNLLGPLVNPASVRHHVVGVGDLGRVETLAKVLAALGSERAWVVHGPDGLDELGLAGPSTVVELANGVVYQHTIRPADAGFAPAPLAALQVADLDGSVARVRAVLAGDRGPSRDVVCLNAAAALVVAGVADDLREGAARAATAIDAGAAADVLARLVAFTTAQQVAS